VHGEFAAVERAVVLGQRLQVLHVVSPTLPIELTPEADQVAVAARRVTWKLRLQGAVSCAMTSSSFGRAKWSMPMYT